MSSPSLVVQSPFIADVFAENPEPRCPCVLVLDTSGSMRESIGEAKHAAADFLRAVMTPKDRAFAVGFSDRPAMLMPLTKDSLGFSATFTPLAKAD